MRAVVEAPVAAAPVCDERLDMKLKPGAMLRLSLAAPCHVNSRVVLRHAGLVFTAQTNAWGSLFLSLPALAADGAVEADFGDGVTVQAALAVPDLAGVRRLGVQWGAGDRFALHGLEGGAEIGAPGDVSALQPGDRTGGGGWLVTLGDASVAAPLLAQIYTYPATGQAEVAIEAEVAADTCGHDMLGQTLASTAGAVSLTDLTLTMPPCDGQVGYLVLKNLFPDMKIAAGN